VLSAWEKREGEGRSAASSESMLWRVQGRGRAHSSTPGCHWARPGLAVALLSLVDGGVQRVQQRERKVKDMVRSARWERRRVGMVKWHDATAWLGTGHDHAWSVSLMLGIAHWVQEGAEEGQRGESLGQKPLDMRGCGVGRLVLTRCLMK
jgi:hypothetical protein